MTSCHALHFPVFTKFLHGAPLCMFESQSRSEQQCCSISQCKHIFWRREHEIHNEYVTYAKVSPRQITYPCRHTFADVHKSPACEQSPALIRKISISSMNIPQTSRDKQALSSAHQRLCRISNDQA